MCTHIDTHKYLYDAKSEGVIVGKGAFVSR